MMTDEKVSLVSHIAASLYGSMTTTSANKMEIAAEEAIRLVAIVEKLVKSSAANAASAAHLEALKGELTGGQGGMETDKFFDE
jgi:hypothetical protein